MAKQKTTNDAKYKWKKAESQRRYEKRKMRIKTHNSTTAGYSGNGGVQDRGAGHRVNNRSSHPLDRARSTYQRAFEYTSLYEKEWTAKKLVQIPVDDMLRGGWEYKNLEEEQSDDVNKALRKIKFFNKLRQALRLERLLGGSVLLMGVADNEDDPSQPLNVEAIGQGDLQFINVIPRTKISHAGYENNPFTPEFGSPKSYYIQGREVHASRLIVFNGDPLTENPNDDLYFKGGNRDGMGESVLGPVYDDILRSVGARQAGYHLIHRASVLLINNQNMQSMLESKGGKDSLRKLDEIADQMDLYQAAMIDGRKIELDQWSAQFGSVPELIMQYLQIISAGSDIPATRFLGQAPGGLNATGESDLENYYNMIDSKRETILRDALEKFFNVFMRSLLGDQFDRKYTELDFPALWNLSETEESSIRTQDAANIVNAFNSGMIDAGFANAEMKERGVYVNDPEGDMMADTDIGADANAGRSSADVLDALKGTEAVPEQSGE